MNARISEVRKPGRIRLLASVNFTVWAALHCCGINILLLMDYDVGFGFVL